MVYNSILDKVEVIMEIFNQEAYSVDVGTRLRQLREMSTNRHGFHGLWSILPV